MKVLIFSHTANLGGAERSLLETLDVLRGLGMDCQVCVPGRGELLSELERRNVCYFILNFKSWVGPKPNLLRSLYKSLVNTLALFRLWFKALEVDVVFTNTAVIPLGALYARLRHKPHVWHLREFVWEDHKLAFDWGEKFSLEFINAFSKAVIANSRAVEAKYRPFIDNAKLSVVYQWVHVQESSAEATEDAVFTCIMVGALSPTKGQQDAIRAVYNLKGQGLKIKLNLLGKGSEAYTAQLKTLVQELELTAEVAFKGEITQPQPFFQIANLALVCSTCEAFGRVTIEAMKVGTPVIGARSGGTTELIQDGVTGLLFEPGDIEDLSAKIASLYHNRDRVSQMGKAAYAWSQATFTREDYGSSLKVILESVERIQAL